MKKRIVYALLASVVGLFSLGLWLSSLLEPDSMRAELEATVPADLPYLREALPPSRGKLLLVVTSTDTLGDTDRYTGYELTELARAYYVFRANGFAVDIASPEGGKPPALIDYDDMGRYDYAFVNDSEAQAQLEQTIAVEHVNGGDYRGVFFVGGKGAMFDFPDDPAIAALVREYDRQGKVIAAVCHGPAALVNVKSEDGRPLVEGRALTGFSNEEELLLIANAREVFPFLLQDRLSELGARFRAGPMYLDTVVQDGHLITGQNPWSVWTLAERAVSQLGYKPVPRERTREENTIAILQTYHHFGNQRARAELSQRLGEGLTAIDRNLLAMHGIVAVMQNRVGKAIDMVNLVRLVKNAQSLKADTSALQSAQN